MRERLAPRWRKATGDLWAHRGRTALAVVAIATGLAGAGTVLDTWALVRVATRDGFLAADPPAATLRLDSVPAAVLEAVRAVPGVRDAEARRTVLARVTVDGTSLSAVLFASDRPDEQRIGRLRGEVGAWPPADGALAIERSSLAFSGAAVGGSVRLQIGDGPVLDAPVVGVARDVTLAPGWMEHVVYGFVTPATLAALGAAAFPDEVRVVVRDRDADREAVRRIAFAARDAARVAGVGVHDVDVPEPGEHVHAAQMDSLLYTQGAFGLMALVLSAFLVVNLIGAMLAGQVREIGVLKAIGARDAQIGALYLVIAGAVGLAAASLAVPVALVAGRQYAALKADLLNFDLTGHALPPWVVLLQVAVAVVMPLAAAWVPVRRAVRMPVAAALRDVGLQGGGMPPWLLRVSGLGRPVLLSLRNAFRRRARLVLTLTALSAAGAVFLGARNLRRAVLGATDLVFAAQRFDFSLRLATPAPADSLAALVREVAGVNAAEAWTGLSATRAHDDGTFGNGFGVVALPARSTLLAPEVVEGRWLAPGDTGAIVVARALRRDEPDLAVGRTVPLVVGGVRRDWTVVGIVNAGPASTSYVSREAVVAAGIVRGEARAGTVVVRADARGEAAQLDLIARLRTTLAAAGHPVAGSTRIAEARRATEDHLLMVVEFLAVMGWLMLLVGGLGLGSTMAIAVLERTRELGVLRAIGASHGALMGLVVAESLTVGLLSWAIALPLSVPMSLALGEAFGRIMLPVASRPLPDGAAVLWWLGLVVAVALVASAWPAWRAARVPAARALSYD